VLNTCAARPWLKPPQKVSVQDKNLIRFRLLAHYSTPRKARKQPRNLSFHDSNIYYDVKLYAPLKSLISTGCTGRTVRGMNINHPNLPEPRQIVLAIYRSLMTIFTPLCFYKINSSGWLLHHYGTHTYRKHIFNSVHSPTAPAPAPAPLETQPHPHSYSHTHTPSNPY
jgi:hypothetical protein